MEVRNQPYRPSPDFLGFLGATALVFVLFVSIPHLALSLAQIPVELTPFPVTVDPKTKTIVGSAPLTVDRLSLTAAAVSGLRDGSAFLAAAIMSTKVYDYVAPLQEPVAVRIVPGMRKEQVASIMDYELGWTNEQKEIFVSKVADFEGQLYPSIYLFSASTTPYEAAEAFKVRFSERVRSRYIVSTEAQVPIADALTLASIIEREAGNKEEMFVISGILWNRLFTGMRLQADSTLAYVRGTSRNGWWPVPRPRDKYLESLYNTYQHEGLPPGPIASPSVAALYAALNPAKTDCVFFFHSKGEFYCSVTYEEHVKQLKKIYGRGR